MTIHGLTLGVRGAYVHAFDYEAPSSALSSVCGIRLTDRDVTPVGVREVDCPYCRGDASAHERRESA